MLSLFQGFLTKVSNVNKDGETSFVELTVKYTNSSSPQVFLKDLSEIVGGDGLMDLFKTPTLWSKITLPFQQEFTMNFDALDFDVQLVEVTIKRKEDEDANIFEYQMKFKKDVSSEIDPVLVTAYLKRKELDPETEKMRLISFGISLSVEEK
jgi:hypothetical protein